MIDYLKAAGHLAVWLTIRALLPVLPDGHPFKDPPISWREFEAGATNEAAIWGLLMAWCLGYTLGYALGALIFL